MKIKIKPTAIISVGMEMELFRYSGFPIENIYKCYPTEYEGVMECIHTIKTFESYSTIIFEINISDIKEIIE